MPPSWRTPRMRPNAAASSRYVVPSGCAIIVSATTRGTTGRLKPLGADWASWGSSQTGFRMARQSQNPAQDDGGAPCHVLTGRLETNVALFALWRSAAQTVARAVHVKRGSDGGVAFLARISAAGWPGDGFSSC